MGLVSNTLVQAPEARKGQKTVLAQIIGVLIWVCQKGQTKVPKAFLEEPDQLNATPMVPKKSKKGPGSLFPGTWNTPRGAAAEGGRLP